MNFMVELDKMFDGDLSIEGLDDRYKAHKLRDDELCPYKVTGPRGEWRLMRKIADGGQFMYPVNDVYAPVNIAGFSLFVEYRDREIQALW